MLGNMGVWWVERFGKWETKHETFGRKYQEHTLTGKRRYIAVTWPEPRSPVHREWLAGGDWELDRPPPPMAWKSRRAGRN